MREWRVVGRKVYLLWAAQRWQRHLNARKVTVVVVPVVPMICPGILMLVSTLRWAGV